MNYIQRVVTNGTFSIDGGTWDVENNVWLIGDDKDVLVFDAAHDARPIIEAVGGRNVVAIVCTHGHDDHIGVAPELGTALDAPILLHGADEMLWQKIHPDDHFHDVSDGPVLYVAGIEVHALHTPGHSPGSTCWSLPELNAVISGDTLFQGGPGATGRSYSDFTTILDSICKRLGTLPRETVVYTGHGETTTVGEEIVHYDNWVARGR